MEGTCEERLSDDNRRVGSTQQGSPARNNSLYVLDTYYEHSRGVHFQTCGESNAKSKDAIPCAKNPEYSHTE